MMSVALTEDRMNNTQLLTWLYATSYAVYANIPTLVQLMH